MPRIGTPFAAPSYLSAQAAQVKSRSTEAATSTAPALAEPLVSAAIRSANSSARAERFSAI
jgi:hypothetical protein